MGGKWDSALKQLIKINPQHFISWLIEGAEYIGELSPHLNRSLDMDALHEVSANGKRFAVHIEFQRRTDTDMAKRVWEYNVLATRFLDYDVVSYVIYLKEDGTVASSPYIRSHPIDDSELHRFYFINVKLWEIPVELFKGTELVALLPLVPLTQNGATHRIIEETVTDIERLVENETTKNELVSLTLTLASLAFLGDKQEQDWLIRRFRMQHDLLHDTPIYQLILEEGREEGIQQGIQQGIQLAHQQKIQEQRNIVQRIVQTKFPKIARISIDKTNEMVDEKKLQDLIVYVSIAQNEEDARQYLLEIDTPETSD